MLWEVLVFNLCRALGYLQYKEYYHDEESIGKHQKYCSSQIKSILPKIISDDNVRALQTYLSFRKVTAKSFEDNMLNPALENGAKECTAFLLAWKKDNLRTPKQKKELSLESLEDPSTITEKQKMKIWQYEKSEDGIRICGYRGDEKDLVIPDSIAGVPVTKIEENAFCWKTKGYTKKKNDRDVYYRRQLQSVVIPETVKEIGRNAFRECGSLEKVVIKGSVEEIKEYTFLRCNNLKSVTLPESLQKIGDSAFSGCESIEEIRIPRGVSVIGSGAFSGCEKLKDVEMPAGLERIEDSTFSNCKELSTITFPNSLNTIGEDTFSGCCNLGRVIFPTNLKNIGKHAFARCKNLITENLAVEEIGEGAFSGCSSMQDENGFYISNGILFNYYGREHKLIIPNGVIKIASFALSGNEELHEVIIADTCEEIHEGVFWGCNNLNSVYIPGSVSYIEHEQFSDYKKVTIKTEPGTYAEEYAKYYGMQVSTN